MTMDMQPGRPGSGPYWIKSSFSFANGNCVEVAALSDGKTGVRDSKDPDLRKLRDEQGHYLRERHRALCGSLLNPRTIYRQVTSKFFIHGCSMTKNLLLCSIAGNFLPVEDRQRCATPEHFAQGTSGGLGPGGAQISGRYACDLR